jgi:hypothetical protein
MDKIFTARLNYKISSKEQPKSDSKFHILLQLWKPTNSERLKELQVALYKNATNTYIDTIHISLENDSAHCVLDLVPVEYLYKIKYFTVDGRLTYKKALIYISTLPKNDFASIINSDIYFDDTIEQLWKIDMTNICIALLRYETSIDYALGVKNALEPKMNEITNWMQDSWIFKVNDVCKRMFDETSFEPLDFQLGVPGCDNAFIAEISILNWKVVNPAFSILTYHLHNSNIRSYADKDRLLHTKYFYINPSIL